MIHISMGRSSQVIALNKGVVGNRQSSRTLFGNCERSKDAKEANNAGGGEGFRPPFSLALMKQEGRQLQ